MSDAKTMVMWGQRKLELDKCGISGYHLSMHGVWNFVSGGGNILRIPLSANPGWCQAKRIARPPRILFLAADATPYGKEVV